MCKIAVIIPVYNAEGTLARSVESLLAQDFADIRLVLVDDGSTDSSPALCDGFAEKDGRVTVIHKPNGGVSSARNVGLDLAEGEYISFFDADDTAAPDYLGTLYKCAAESGADIAVCDVVCTVGGVETRRFSCNAERLDGKAALEKLLERREINSGPCAKLYKAETVGSLRFPEMRTYEDLVFNLNAFDRAKTVACCHAEYYYEENSGGAMARFTAHPTEDVVVASQSVADYLVLHGGEFSDKAFYATASHLLQYVRAAKDKPFLQIAVRFYKTHRRSIRKSKAFTRKEKLIYLLLSYGYLYKNGRVKRV